MTDPGAPPPATPPSPSSSAWKRLLVGAGAVAGGAGLAFGAFNGGVDAVGHVVDWIRPTGTSSGNSAPPPAAEELLQREELEPPAFEVGDCLLDVRAVACDVGHDREVIGTGSGDCTSAGLVTYLGGRPDVDVLGGRLQLLSVDPEDESATTAATCLAAISAPVVSGSLAQTLRTSAGDAWRRCSDGSTGEDVACSQVHDGEYVFWTADGTEELDCTDRVLIYTDVPWSSLSGDLSLHGVSTAEGRGCRLEARGGRSLQGSLRNIGTQALPFVTAS